MKKLLITMATIMVSMFCANAQNIQLHYDFGKKIYNQEGKQLNNRASITSTIEMFKADKLGSTFFFVDMDYGTYANQQGVVGAYWEISREFRFWKAPISAHIEYNGGAYRAFGINNAYLAGPSFSWANKDYSKTFSLMALYKYIQGNSKPNNFQITGVWNLYFCNRAILFAGFIDFWKEKNAFLGSNYTLLTEPQLWYNLNTLSCMKDVNLSIGTEVEISNNFVGKGFYAVPTLGLKYTF